MEPAPQPDAPAAPSRARPASVVLIARTHWLVGGVIFVSVLVLHFFTRQWPIEFSPRAYATTLGLGGLYGLGGAGVWLGLPGGRLLSRVCGLLYLARPNFGSYVWQLMSTPEFQAHFSRRSGNGR